MRKCKNCLHWNKQHKLPKTGRCEKIKENLIFQTNGINGVGSVLTPDNFGCNCFK